MYKTYVVAHTVSGDVIESFSTLQAAEKFLHMLKAKGEDVILRTNQEDIVDDTPEEEFQIDPGDLAEPDIPDEDYGSELDDEFEDTTRPEDQLFDTDDV